MEKSSSGIAFRQVNEISSKEDRYEPFSWYSKMRAETPIRYDKERQSWDVFLYEDVKHVLEKKDLFSSNRSGGSAKKSPIEQSIINIDPPKHSQMRSIVNKAFTPRAMKDWEPRIERIVQQLLDEMSGKTEADAVKEFSNPLPVMVIAEILGVPVEDQPKFKEWSDWVVAGPKDNSEKELLHLQENQGRTYQELNDYFLKTIEHKRSDPGHDIISVLLEAQVEGEKLTDDEVIGFCILLLVAGNETTTNLITNAFYCFTEYPEIYQSIKENSETSLPLVIEEVLRYRSPVQAMSRVVKEDTELRGEKLAKGDYIVAWIGSANRDDLQFDHAQTFDASRKRNPHMAFGKGIHFCLGAPLARMEAEIALREWIKRYPDFKRSSSFSLEPIESTFVYGLKECLLKVE